MLPMMWNQPPCRNMCVTGVSQFGAAESTQ